jgi:hypothetical protein
VQRRTGIYLLRLIVIFDRRHFCQWRERARHLSGGAGVTTFGSTSHYDAHIRTNGSDRLHITSGGNDGIGTTSPNMPFYVNAALGTQTNFVDTTPEVHGILVRFANPAES